MKKSLLKKGFTLIELLVVIAIIGILSGIVLTSLGTARNKAKSSSAVASLSSMRAQAELGMTSGGTYSPTLCTGTSNGELGALRSAVTGQGAAVKCATKGASPTGWIVVADLTSLESGKYYCVDSLGAATSTVASVYSGVTDAATTQANGCNGTSL